ncbi:hypothetical protein VJ918_11645, partial [Adlercreutzia sp. R21]|uniref:hypothetical protein n=1 Tax=Adlercreutzia wanghongyangiae TaxID=3111451 RepID=UPI002DBEDBC3
MASAIDSSSGIPLTLVGRNETKITYYARITQVAGAAVSLGQQLIEDSFGGTQESGVTLLSPKALKPLPDDANPDDPSSWGTAGKDYHYTRLPAANVNGWNNSPVTVTFYPGDFDQMALTPSEGAAATLTGTDPAWTRSDDTAGLSLSAQATNSSTGAVSTQRAGKVKIDTWAPRIERDAALEAYTLTDVPSDPSKATSGIWRLHRTGSSGAPAAGARAGAYKPFDLTDGDGKPTQAVGKLPNGYYVAEDAAGNLSAPVKVSSTEPPTVERPAGSVLDPSDPGYAPPVGPELGPGADPVPA